MAVEVTLIIQGNGPGGGTFKYEKTSTKGGDNPYFHASNVRALIADHMEWATVQLSNLVKGHTLSDEPAIIVVRQADVDALRRDAALLARMRAAGVNNWEGMDNLPPED